MVLSFRTLFYDQKDNPQVWVKMFGLNHENATRVHAKKLEYLNKKV